MGVDGAPTVRAGENSQVAAAEVSLGPLSSVTGIRGTQREVVTRAAAAAAAATSTGRGDGQGSIAPPSSSPDDDTIFFFFFRPGHDYKEPEALDNLNPSVIGNCCANWLTT